MSLSPVLRFLLLLIAAPLFAGAQPAAPEKLVSARLLCLSLMNSEPVDLYVIVDKKPVLLRVPVDYFGTPVDYRGPVTLGIYSKSAPPVAPAEGQPPSGPQPLATIDLPETGGEFVLLFGGTATAPKLALVDYSEAKAPVGSYLFWNLTGRRIAVALDGTSGIMPAGQQSLLAPSAPADGYMALRVFDEFEGRERQLFAARHFHMEKARQLIFITDAANANRVRLKIITQRVFPPAAPTVASRR